VFGYYIILQFSIKYKSSKVTNMNGKTYKRKHDISEGIMPAVVSKLQQGVQGRTSLLSHCIDFWYFVFFMLY